MGSFWLDSKLCCMSWLYRWVGWFQLPVMKRSATLTNKDCSIFHSAYQLCSFCWHVNCFRVILCWLSYDVSSKYMWLPVCLLTSKRRNCNAWSWVSLYPMETWWFSFLDGYNWSDNSFWVKDQYIELFQIEHARIAKVFVCISFKCYSQKGSTAVHDCAELSWIILRKSRRCFPKLNLWHFHRVVLTKNNHAFA
jgi:hypothetical protein